MTKKTILSLALISALGVAFSGCASDGLALNTLSKNRVDRYFHKGYIVEQKKVIINDKETAVLTDAGAGAVVTGATTQSVKNGVIGGVVGGLIGAVVGKEIVAFETTIKSGNKLYKGYLKQQLPKNTYVEFTIADDKLKNVNIISKSDDVFLEKTEVKKQEKKIQKVVIIKKEILITDRKKKDGVWYYKLADDTVVYDSQYYPYKGDLVRVSYNEKTRKITSMKLIKSYTRRVKKTVQKSVKADDKFLAKVVEKKEETKSIKTTEKVEYNNKKTVQIDKRNDTKQLKKVAQKEPKKTVKKESSVW